MPLGGGRLNEGIIRMKKILVVDDEKEIRAILKKILTREGYKVQSAQDGREAIRQFKKGGFELLVTDLRMPGPGVDDMLPEIERLDPAVKVVLITGYPLTPVIQQKVTAGRYVYFAKPFDNKILVAKLKELLA